MKRLLTFICALCALTAHAKVRLPQFFSDNMVLQQQSECKLWGWAEPGKKVQVITSWDKKEHPTTARKDGYFQVTVKTLKPAGLIRFILGMVIPSSYRTSSLAKCGYAQASRTWRCR